MSIAHACAEKQVQDTGKRGIADMTVLPRHGASCDSAPEPIAHAYVVAVLKFGDHRHAFGEIITSIAIAHDDVAAPCAATAADKGCAVPFLLNRNDPSTELGRERLAAVSRTIVGNYDLARQAELRTHSRQRFECIADTMRKGIQLVQARHDDRDIRKLLIRTDREFFRLYGFRHLRPPKHPINAFRLSLKKFGKRLVKMPLSGNGEHRSLAILFRANFPRQFLPCTIPNVAASCSPCAVSRCSASGMR